MLGNDKALKTLQNSHATLRKLDDVTVAVLQDHVRVNHHIVVGTLLQHLVDTMPRAHICPAKVTAHHTHVRSTLQDAIVDRQVRVQREILTDISILVGNTVVRRLTRQHTQHLGKQRSKAVEHRTQARQEHTRIPIELTALHEHTRKVAVRLLRERLHMEHLRLLLLANL